MRSDFLIVPASPEHAAEMAEIEKLCFSEPWSLDFIVRRLADPTNVFFAALAPSGSLAGYVGMATVLDEGYIHNVAVRAEYRRQGLGEALVRRMAEHGQKANLRFITLEVRRSNQPARELYSKLGFAEVGERRNYYTRPSEDAVLMTLFFPKGERNVI